MKNMIHGHLEILSDGHQIIYKWKGPSKLEMMMSVNKSLHFLQLQAVCFTSKFFWLLLSMSTIENSNESSLTVLLILKILELDCPSTNS